VRVQINGVVVVMATGRFDVALATSEIFVPAGALVCGEKAIVCEAFAPGCGVIIPVIETADNEVIGE
jgi:hypothetical protein